MRIRFVFWLLKHILRIQSKLESIVYRPRTLYWVGGNSIWDDDPMKWSTSPGGPPGASIPTQNDHVIIGGSFNLNTKKISVPDNG